MKKKNFVLMAMMAALTTSSIASASTITVEGSIQGNTAVTMQDGVIAKSYPINKDQEVIYYSANSSDAGSIKEVIDHNPTSYQKMEVAGHTVESWVENGVAYTKDNGQLVKSYKVNGHIDKIVAKSGDDAGSIIRTVDHNPTLEQTVTLLGHTAKSWLEGNEVKSEVDGRQGKTYTINKDIETIYYDSKSSDNAGSIKEVIDHNPDCYQTMTIELGE